MAVSITRQWSGCGAACESRLFTLQLSRSGALQVLAGPSMCVCHTPGAVGGEVELSYIGCFNRFLAIGLGRV